jgi:hypothetical protein
MMKTSPSREEWRETVEVYTAHRYIDFFLGYQRGWVGFVSNSQSGQQLSINAFAYLDRDKPKCTAFENDLKEEVDRWVLATWKVPRLLVEVGKELAAKQSATKPLPDVTNRVLLLPHVPIEFLNSIATFRQQSVTQLESLLTPSSSVQVSCEPPPTETESHASDVPDSGRVLEEEAVRSELQFAEKHFAEAARSAWMLAYAHSHYYKQLRGLRTNYDHSSAELASFLQGCGEPLLLKRQSVTRLTKELAELASVETGAQVLPLLKIAEKRESPSLGDILRVVAPADPYPTNIRTRDEPPDLCLLKLILEKSISKPPVPSDCGEWLREIYRTLNAVESDPKLDDESMTQRWEHYLETAKLALASTNPIPIRDLLADHGRQYPAMCATVLYYRSEELNDFEKLKIRVKSFKPPISVRWLSYSLFGAWNGFESKQLLSLLPGDGETAKAIFVRAFTLLAARKCNLQKPDLREPSLEADMFFTHTPGGETLAASIGGIKLLKFKFTESHIDLAKEFRSMLLSSGEDHAIKKKLEVFLEKLALTSIPEIKRLLECESKEESKESQAICQQGKVIRKGPYRDFWSIPSEHWRNFIASINESWFTEHVRLHEQAFAQFIQRHGRGSH